MSPWVLPPRQSALGSIVVEAFHASGSISPHSGGRRTRRDAHKSGGHRTLYFDFSGFGLQFFAGRPELKALPVKHSLSRVPVGIVTLKNPNTKSRRPSFS